tara:strand:+ start:1086 stop:1226 length:141 start_codon:yes stop_codon:yes gene_type:complete
MTDKKNNPFMSSMIVFSSSDIRDKSEDELKLDALSQLKMKKQRKND